MSRGRRAGLLRALALAVVAAAAPARAQDGSVDYDAASEAWNGLAQFARLARARGMRVESRRDLAWDELGPGDVLVILYPTSSLDPGNVKSFLHNGGRLLIGDDFGQASLALGQLGLVRSAAVGVVAARYHEGDQDLPVARALVPDHPLAEGVAELTTNHPALFTESEPGTAVYGFGAREVVVAAGPYGAGRFVALADPSILINRMLELEGNLGFAMNALGFLGPPGGGGRVIIASGGFTLSGQPTRPQSDERGVASVLSGVNGWLDDLNLWTLQPIGLRVGAILLAIGGALALRRLLTSTRKDALTGAWTRVAGREPEGAAALIAALDHPVANQSYVLPAAVLRDTVNRRVGAALGIDDPLFSLSAHDLRRAVDQRAGADAADAIAVLIPLLRHVPSPSQAGSPWAFAHLGRRDFDRIAVAADRLYRSLARDPARRADDVAALDRLT